MIRYVSIFFVSKFLRLKNFIKGHNSVHNHDDLENSDLSRYVIYLEGEEGLVGLMTENNCDATAHWIKIGEKQQPRKLIKLLERADSRSQTKFKGVQDFDSDKIPSLCSLGEPPNCWALPIVTLTSIASSIPGISEELVEQLVCGVDEGLKYINEIENYLHEKKDLKHVRKAAEIVWAGVELYNKWLDVDLYKLAHQEHETETKTETETIKILSKISKENFMEFSNDDMSYVTDCLKEDPSRWPIRVLAANSMYRICETLLLHSQHDTNQRLFDNISGMICDILTAALSNLQNVISRKCHENRIEEREKSIRSAILLFGKTKKILEIIDSKRPEDSNHGKLIHIDDWSRVSKKMVPICSMSSSTDEDTGVSSSPDFYISIS